jgi:ferredoxin-NADP reductase
MAIPGKSSATAVTKGPPATRLQWRIAEVTALRDETPRARSLTFRVADWTGHIAGQHMDVRLTAADGYQTQRSYSIASIPQASELELLVDLIPEGEVSPYLTQEVRPGDRIEMRGPIGGYFVWTAAHGGPLMLIAAGSGVVPLASMLAYRAQSAPGLPTRLLYSVRTSEDVIFRARLDSWARQDPTLTVVLTLTRGAPTDWTGYRRRIDVDMLRQVAFSCDQSPLAYVCGPTSMVEETADHLVALGYPPERVRTERFGPSGDPR